MAKASNNDELNAAMKSGANTNEIEGDLVKKVIRLKATGNVAWAIALGCIGLAVIALITSLPATVATGGLATPAEALVVSSAVAPAVAILGLDVAMMAVGLAVAAGGVGALTRLRSDYKIIEQAPDRVVLQKVAS